MKHLAALTLLILPLAGCYLQPPRPEIEQETRPPPPTEIEVPICETHVTEVLTGADDTLVFLANLKKQSPAELKASLQQARKDFTETGSEAARMRLILLYMHPGAPFRNEAQAIQLLDPYIRDNTNPSSPYRGIAQMLLTNLEEVRRAETVIQAQAAKTREEQKRGDELQRKLDAMMDVERAMILKDQNPRKK